VVSYEAGGRQYVALTSGNISRGTFSAATGSPKIVIMTTGLTRDAPRIVAIKDDTPHAAADGGDNAGSGHGKTLFGQYCSGCHGATGEGNIGPALKGEAAKKNSDEVAAFIKSPKAPMPKLYPAPLGDADVSDLARFVETLR
jgi:mono/diheme cytochrome c family protein